eukprot:5592956-Pyramimonas_sp.AAC.1
MLAPSRTRSSARTLARSCPRTVARQRRRFQRGAPRCRHRLISLGHLAWVPFRFVAHLGNETRYTMRPMGLKRGSLVFGPLRKRIVAEDLRGQKSPF